MNLLSKAVESLVNRSGKAQPAMAKTPDDDLKFALADYEKETDPDRKAKAFKAALEIYKLMGDRHTTDDPNE